MASTKFIEVDLAEKDALRAMNEISRHRALGLMARQGEYLVPNDAHAYEITADGIPVGTFVNLYVDGTWTASTNINVGEE